MKAEDSLSCFRMMRSSSWIGANTLKYPHNDKVSLENFMFFVGIYLADGFLGDRESNANTIQIAAGKESKKNNFRQILDQLPLKIYERDDRFSFSDKEFKAYFYPLGEAPQKYIPVEKLQNCLRETKRLLI